MFLCSQSNWKIKKSQNLFRNNILLGVILFLGCERPRKEIETKSGTENVGKRQGQIKRSNANWPLEQQTRERL